MVEQTNGCIYWGDLRNGEANGNGLFFDLISNTIYEGEWQDDQPHGKGTEYWNDG